MGVFCVFSYANICKDVLFFLFCTLHHYCKHCKWSLRLRQQSLKGSKRKLGPRMQKMSILCGCIVFLQQEGALGLKVGSVKVVWHVSITTLNPICLTLSSCYNKVMPFITSLPVFYVFLYNPLGGANGPLLN